MYDIRFLKMYWLRTSTLLIINWIFLEKPNLILYHIYMYFKMSIQGTFAILPNNILFSRAGHSLFISRFALRSPLFSFPWIAIALALI